LELGGDRGHFQNSTFPAKIPVKIYKRTSFMALRTRLGSIHGIGTILVGSCTYGDVSYFIEVWHEQNGLIRTDGIIDARIEVFERIRRTEDLVLMLMTGEKVPIIITDIDTGHAEIRIFGPVARELRERGYMRIVSLAPEVI
jgi:ribosomal protein L14